MRRDSLEVLALQVVEEAPAAPTSRAASAASSVLRVRAEVLRELVDPPGEHRDLDLGRAGVLVVLPVLRDQLLLGFLGESHRSPLDSVVSQSPHAVKEEHARAAIAVCVECSCGGKTPRVERASRPGQPRARTSSRASSTRRSSSSVRCPTWGRAGVDRADHVAHSALPRLQARSRGESSPLRRRRRGADVVVGHVTVPTVQPPLRLLRLGNPIVRAVLDSPAHRLLSGTLVVVAYRGHRSGRTFRPLRYAQTTDGAVVAVAGWSASAGGGRSPSPDATLMLRGGNRVEAIGALAEGDDCIVRAAYVSRFPRSAALAQDAAIVVFTATR